MIPRSLLRGESIGLELIEYPGFQVKSAKIHQGFLTAAILCFHTYPDGMGFTGQEGEKVIAEKGRQNQP